MARISSCPVCAGPVTIHRAALGGWWCGCEVCGRGGFGEGRNAAESAWKRVAEEMAEDPAEEFYREQQVAAWERRRKEMEE